MSAAEDLNRLYSRHGASLGAPDRVVAQDQTPSRGDRFRSFTDNIADNTLKEKAPWEAKDAIYPGVIGSAAGLASTADIGLGKYVGDKMVKAPGNYGKFYDKSRSRIQDVSRIKDPVPKGMGSTYYNPAIASTPMTRVQGAGKRALRRVANTGNRAASLVQGPGVSAVGKALGWDPTSKLGKGTRATVFGGLSGLGVGAIQRHFKNKAFNRDAVQQDRLGKQWNQR